MKKFYLAYGSNLNVKQMQFRCPDARIVGTAEIPNYQLLFKGSKTGSYLTIEPKQGCTVPAAVWSVSERDELALDRYEGYPHFYYKTELELPLAETGKKADCLCVYHARGTKTGHSDFCLHPHLCGRIPPVRL